MAVSLIAVWSLARHVAQMSLGRAEFHQAIQTLRQEIPLTLMRFYGTGEGSGSAAQMASFHQAVSLVGTRWNVELRPVDVRTTINLARGQESTSPVSGYLCPLSWRRTNAALSVFAATSLRSLSTASFAASSHAFTISA